MNETKLDRPSMKLADVLEWIVRVGYRETKFTPYYRKAVADFIRDFTSQVTVDGDKFVSVSQLSRFILKDELRKMECDVITYHSIFTSNRETHE
jgi:hypothetical protein